MKYILSVLIFSICIFSANAQVLNNSLHGKILDPNQNSLPGASVIILGTKYGVNANEVGEYRFDQLPSGKIKVQVSYVGFKTVTEDFDVQPGQNSLNITLENDNIKLNSVIVTSQKSVELSLFGSNLLSEKYIVSAGNTGSLFGDPTQIPGPPRMFGTKLRWKF